MAFEIEQKVLFKHCDPAGIVFFPRYFEMMNDCVEHFFDRRLEWPFEILLRGGGIPTAEIHTTFVRPSRHGDVLRLALRVITVGATSFAYDMQGACGAETRFTAEARLVHTGPEGRPTAWPDRIRQTLLSLKEMAP